MQMFLFLLSFQPTKMYQLELLTQRAVIRAVLWSTVWSPAVLSTRTQELWYRHYFLTWWGAPKGFVMGWQDYRVNVYISSHSYLLMWCLMCAWAATSPTWFMSLQKGLIIVPCSFCHARKQWVGDHWFIRKVFSRPSWLVPCLELLSIQIWDKKKNSVVTKPAGLWVCDLAIAAWSYWDQDTANTGWVRA